MRVLVACEFSGVVRRAFRARHYDAWSCDLLPAEDGRPEHIQGNVLDHLDEGWDLMIAHPPCTHLAVSGARWFPSKIPEQREALEFVQRLMDAPVRHIALENPVSIISSRIRKPDQIIQPWQFGHGETKATCLWLKNLPKLVPTDIVEGREGRVWKMAPSEDRWKERSRFLPGIAAGMADQWGDYCDSKEKGMTILDKEQKTLAERLRKWIPAYRDCVAAADALESYKKRCERADHIILMLTADHNSGPHYVKGFDMAQEYFQDFSND